MGICKPKGRLALRTPENAGADAISRMTTKFCDTVGSPTSLRRSKAKLLEAHPTHASAESRHRRMLISTSGVRCFPPPSAGHTRHLSTSLSSARGELRSSCAHFAAQMCSDVPDFEWAHLSRFGHTWAYGLFTGNQQPNVPAASPTMISAATCLANAVGHKPKLKGGGAVMTLFNLARITAIGSTEGANGNFMFWDVFKEFPLPVLTDTHRY
ncbi:hypothetical protein B0H13DRAFT_1865609 [Mycena leptocephala]|nr:hypothetical protein B0H13DRAFT_1865609 [Mycena leptocephala]